ncbi:MAG: hypothetical protein ACRDRU_08250 [Pseudonocardiaceae bacterium]
MPISSLPARARAELDALGRELGQVVAYMLRQTDESLLNVSRRLISAPRPFFNLDEPGYRIPSG